MKCSFDSLNCYICVTCLCKYHNERPAFRGLPLFIDSISLEKGIMPFLVNILFLCAIRSHFLFPYFVLCCIYCLKSLPENTGFSQQNLHEDQLVQATERAHLISVKKFNLHKWRNMSVACFPSYPTGA